MEGSVDRAPSPSGVLFGLAVLAATGISFVAWLLIALGTLFDWLWGAEWIYTGLALPAATIGAIVAYTTQRPRYFWLGLAITLIPLVAYVFLDATAPPPPPGWND